VQNKFFAVFFVQLIGIVAKKEKIDNEIVEEL